MIKSIWLDISDIPAEGREFSFDDQAVWTGPAAAFGMDATVTAPLSATVRVWPHGRGATMAGRLTGEVTLPCARCTRPAPCAVDQEFEVSESLDDEDATGESPLREQDGKIELDAGAILWEQFVLALPGKALCSPGCKGLCARCGADLNLEPCACGDEEGDPRLAALRGLTIGRKN
ncbi:DUF177 domain-containing protein [Desulfocurvus sp.]|jgi:uncharacterized protein|uniref:YceD family protein n=1 Tax=Desulfocurvus sp. TaxID=2871698 RepID=UPI0025BE4428|nr:DUF177 domain-containing protein [Desulfocurvus sp.]MCK9240353.1 DUF177 domain-containing protein [Desulfocurvus sp.]